MQFQQINLNEFNNLNTSTGDDLHLRADGSIDVDFYVGRAQSARAAETAAAFRAIRQAVSRIFA
ncbi:MAG: hypothetical protein P1U65_11090 [Minwuia sp.]|nr:hypothetical protein [Minwuia sp.]